MVIVVRGWRVWDHTGQDKKGERKIPPFADKRGFDWL